MQNLTIKAIALAAIASANVVQANPATSQLFALFDTDNNGALSISEYKNAGTGAEDQQWSQGVSSACTEQVLKSVEPELTAGFAELDADNNQSISRQEFIDNGERIYTDYWQASFKAADDDNNQLLSREEYRSQSQAYLSSLNKAYSNETMATECKADVEYWQAYYQAMNEYVDMSFNYLDENQDGALTFPEYLGTHLFQ